jgi:hypothetical protein
MYFYFRFLIYDDLMNTPIVNTTFRFVKRLYQQYLPEGFDQFQLDQAMIQKNKWVSKGLQAQLSDEEIEVLALTALLARISMIDNKQSVSASKLIAERFLAEQNFPSKRILSLLHAIDVVHKKATPCQHWERILMGDLFEEIGDVWP